MQLVDIYLTSFKRQMDLLQKTCQQQQCFPFCFNVDKQIIQPPPHSLRARGTHQACPRTRAGHHQSPRDYAHYSVHVRAWSRPLSNRSVVCGSSSLTSPHPRDFTFSAGPIQLSGCSDSVRKSSSSIVPA